MSVKISPKVVLPLVFAMCTGAGAIKSCNDDVNTPKEQTEVKTDSRTTNPLSITTYALGLLSLASLGVAVRNNVQNQEEKIVSVPPRRKIEDIKPGQKKFNNLINEFKTKALNYYSQDDVNSIIKSTKTQSDGYVIQVMNEILRNPELMDIRGMERMLMYAIRKNLREESVYKKDSEDEVKIRCQNYLDFINKLILSDNYSDIFFHKNIKPHLDNILNSLSSTYFIINEEEAYKQYIPVLDYIKKHPQLLESEYFYTYLLDASNKNLCISYMDYLLKGGKAMPYSSYEQQFYIEEKSPLKLRERFRNPDGISFTTLPELQKTVLERIEKQNSKFASLLEQYAETVLTKNSLQLMWALFEYITQKNKIMDILGQQENPIRLNINFVAFINAVVNISRFGEKNDIEAFMDYIDYISSKEAQPLFENKDIKEHPLAFVGNLSLDLTEEQTRNCAERIRAAIDYMKQITNNNPEQLKNGNSMDIINDIIRHAKEQVQRNKQNN